MNAADYLETKDGAKIYYEERGEGQPILLVHGWMCSSRFWQKNVPELADEFRVVTIDLRGHGNSCKTLSGHTMAQYARDVRALIEHLGLEETVLVGWSLGGRVVLSYYEQYGSDGRVRALVTTISESVFREFVLGPPTAGDAKEVRWPLPPLLQSPPELFPTGLRNTAMGTAFNVGRGAQFFTPVIIAVVAKTYGLHGGLSLAAIFALACAAWIWTFPETRGKKLCAAENLSGLGQQRGRTVTNGLA